MTSWPITTDGFRVQLGERFAVSFQRTLRIPDDGKRYPLPPTLGMFPVRQVSAYASAVPPAWLEQGGFFFPMYQSEALWLAFEGAPWKPNAVKVGIGRINAVSGEAWDEALRSQPQDYLVCPLQPWLDGINSGAGVIRQFVAMPLGLGVTVEAQLSGEEQFGGLQLLVIDPKPGLFPDQPPPPPPMPEMPPGLGQALGLPVSPLMAAFAPQGAPPPEMGEPADMGLAAGGQVQQSLYPDPHGVETWDLGNSARLFIHIVNSQAYQRITGEAPPPSPVNPQVYNQHGFPWFELYDDDLGKLDGSAKLAGVQSLGKLLPGQEGGSLEINPEQIKKIEP
jgi:hypothetical protein